MRASNLGLLLCVVPSASAAPVPKHLMRPPPPKCVGELPLGSVFTIRGIEYRMTDAYTAEETQNPNSPMYWLPYDTELEKP